MPMDIQTKDVNEFRQRLGFNDPVPVQYARFVAGAARGDFGESLPYRQGPVSLRLAARARARAPRADSAESLRYRQDAMSLVLARLPATRLLAGTSMLLTFAV